MKRRVLLVSVVTLVVLIGIVLTYLKMRAAQQQAIAVPTAENKLLAAVAPPPPAKTAAPLEQKKEPVYETPADYDVRELAPSLAETTINGKLTADADGDLILGPEVRDFFDYFLNTLGEATPEQLTVEIRRLAEAHLPPKAVDQTIQLLAEYSVYKAAALRLMQAPLASQEHQDQEAYIRSLEDSFNQLQRVRRRHLSPEVVEAFYGLEELYSEYTFDYLRIQADPLLSEEQKSSLIALRRQTLPESIRKSEEQAEAESRQAAEVYAAIEQAVDEIEVRTVPARYAYTPEQVEEVVQAFREQRAFNQKYQRYSQEKERIALADVTADEEARQVAEVRDRIFTTDNERLMAQLRDLNESADMTSLLPAN